MLPGHRNLAAILLAETTETSSITGTRLPCSCVNRGRCAAVCRLPRDSRAAFVSAVQRDLARSLALSSYLDPTKGGDRQTTPPRLWYCRQIRRYSCSSSGRAHLAVAHAEVEPERIANPTYRELVGRHSPDRGLEQFKQEILRALQPQPLPVGPRLRRSVDRRNQPGTTRD